MRTQIAKWLCYLTAAICILTAITFANIQERMWPFPGLYLIEIALVGLLAAVSATKFNRESIQMAWAIGGVLLTFSFLGAMTIGPMLSPAFLFILLAAMLKTWREWKMLGIGAGILIVASVLQGATMIIIMQSRYFF